MMRCIFIFSVTQHFFWFSITLFFLNGNHAKIPLSLQLFNSAFFLSKFASHKALLFILLLSAKLFMGNSEVSHQKKVIQE